MRKLTAILMTTTILAAAPAIAGEHKLVAEHRAECDKSGHGAGWHGRVTINSLIKAGGADSYENIKIERDRHAAGLLLKEPQAGFGPLATAFKDDYKEGLSAGLQGNPGDYCIGLAVLDAPQPEATPAPIDKGGLTPNVKAPSEGGIVVRTSEVENSGKEATNTGKDEKLEPEDPVNLDKSLTSASIVKVKPIIPVKVVVPVFTKSVKIADQTFDLLFDARGKGVWVGADLTNRSGVTAALGVNRELNNVLQIGGFAGFNYDLKGSIVNPFFGVKFHRYKTDGLQFSLIAYTRSFEALDFAAKGKLGYGLQVTKRLTINPYISMTYVDSEAKTARTIGDVGADLITTFNESLSTSLGARYRYGCTTSTCESNLAAVAKVNVTLIDRLQISSELEAPVKDWSIGDFGDLRAKVGFRFDL